MTLKWDGIAELNKALATVSSDLENKIGRSATAAAANVVKRQAIRNAKTDVRVLTGTLTKNIATKRIRAPRFKHTYQIGVRNSGGLYRSGKAVKSLVARTKTAGFRIKRIGDPYYWRFLELGTKYIKRKDFIGNAIQSEAQKALDKMSEVIRKRIERANRTGR
jgi:HK97 gp10 family phage protein